MSRMYVIAGPRAVGKDTIIHQVAREMDCLVGVSHTTRQPRAGEAQDREYHFCSNDEFVDLFQRRAFIESDYHFGAQYGFAWREWHGAVERRKDLIVILDPNGLAQATGHGTVPITSFFIMPTDGFTLASRMKERGMSEDDINASLQRAKWEIGQAHTFDYEVINYNGAVHMAVSFICDVIQEQRDGR